MSNIFRRVLAGILLLSTAAFFNAVSNQSEASAQTETQRQHALRLYKQYKESYAALESAEARLNDLRAQSHEAASAGTIGGGTYLGRSGLGQEMNQLREKSATLRQVMSNLEKAWEKAGFVLPYGPLIDARKSERDPKTNVVTDPTAKRLAYTQSSLQTRTI